MEHLATVEQVAARVAEEISTADELDLADAMLLEASAWVRSYAGQTWADPALAPAVAVAITVAAAARGYMNPAAFLMERSDMSTFNRIPEYAAGTQLTPAEIKMLRPFNRAGGVISVGMTDDIRPAPRHGRRRAGRYEDRGYAPDGNGAKPWPLGAP